MAPRIAITAAIESAGLPSKSALPGRHRSALLVESPGVGRVSTAEHGFVQAELDTVGRPPKGVRAHRRLRKCPCQ